MKYREGFCAEVRSIFESEYPEELHHMPYHPKFAEIEHWHIKQHAKGWVAPARPAEFGGMELESENG